MCNYGRIQMQTPEFRTGISINHKIMFYAIMLIFIAVGISTYIAVRTESGVLTEELMNNGRQVVKNIAISSEAAFAFLSWISVEKILQESTNSEKSDVIYTKLIKHDGEVYLANDRKYYGEQINSSLLSDREMVLEEYVFDETKERGILLIHPFSIGTKRWYVLLGISQRNVKQAVNALIIRNLVWGGGIVLLGIVASFFLSRSISSPIVNLSKVSTLVANGDWNQYVRIRSKDEVGLLCHSFNRMIIERKRAQEALQTLNQELEQRVRERTHQLEEAHARVMKLEKEALELQMAGGFAHEMRNALTSADLVLDRLIDHKGTLSQKTTEKLKNIFDLLEPTIPKNHWNTVIEYFKAIGQEQENLDEALKLINIHIRSALTVTKLILDYARIGRAEAGHETVNVQDVVEQIIQQHSERFAAQKIALSLNGTVNCTILGHTSHFHSMINNLVMNAYNAIESVTDDRPRRMEITLTQVDQKQVVKIRDNANGIPEEARQKIFEPFYSTNPTTGVGLGLSFVSKLVVLYHGTIEVESEVGKGTAFTLTFPIQN